MKIGNRALTQSDYRDYWLSGVQYSTYLKNFEQELLRKEKLPYGQYLPINWQRTQRIEKSFKLSDKLKTQLTTLKESVRWLLISEHWCGDAAQILPVLNGISEASNGKIELRIVYRDQNPDLMNAHLTGSSKSIPKLVQLDKNFVVTGQWGPRPIEAQKLVLQLKADPITAPTYAERLHKWYALDRQQSIEREISKLVQKAAGWCADCFVH